MKQQQQDRSKACRACTNGWGDGICSYHAEQFRKLKKVLAIREKRKQ